MGYLIIAGFVFLMVCIAYGFAGGLLYLIYLPFKKKLIKKGKLTKQKSKLINRLYIGLIFLLAVFSTWTAFFPMNGFYKEEFENNTELKFPESGKIISKDSEYPDFHGDYWAAAIIEVNEKDFKKLKDELINSENFIVDTSNKKIGITREFDNLIKNIEYEDIEIVFLNKTKEWFKIAFLKDGKTIIFERSST
ncbi:MAG: hypothetical protein QM499_01305 [Flavobacteriaceae bacterium]